MISPATARRSKYQRQSLKKVRISEILFCKGGGCTAKLGAGVLSRVLELLPKGVKDEKITHKNRKRFS